MRGEGMPFEYPTQTWGHHQPIGYGGHQHGPAAQGYRPCLRAIPASAHLLKARRPPLNILVSLQQRPESSSFHTWLEDVLGAEAPGCQLLLAELSRRNNLHPPFSLLPDHTSCSCLMPTDHRWAPRDRCRKILQPRQILHG